MPSQRILLSFSWVFEWSFVINLIHYLNVWPLAYRGINLCFLWRFDCSCLILKTHYFLNLEQEAIWINSKYQGQWTSHLVEQVSKESPICWRIWSFILLINTCCMIMKPLLPLLSSLYCRNQAHPGWTASSPTWLTSFCWRTLPPSRWRLPSWSKSFQI